MFFLTETKNNPKHVEALMRFQVPEKVRKRFVAGRFAAYRKARPNAPFNYVCKFPLIGAVITRANRVKSVAAVDRSKVTSRIRSRLRATA